MRGFETFSRSHASRTFLFQDIEIQQPYQKSLARGVAYRPAHTISPTLAKRSASDRYIS